MENNKKVTKKDLFSVFIRSFFHQASWNYERMQALGFCFDMIPIIRRLYSTKEDISRALKRHLEFFNTHQFMIAPILGVTAAMEESRANGGDIEDKAISGVKVGLMGPLAGVGDPLFLGTLRPILAALGATIALTGSIVGPILFFILFNAVRLFVLWYGIDYGYKKGVDVVSDILGDNLKKLTEFASILGLFVMGALVSKWTVINVPLQVSRVVGADGKVVITTVQTILDQLMPGLLALALTFICMKLINKKMNTIWIIFGLFALGIIGNYLGILS